MPFPTQTDQGTLSCLGENHKNFFKNLTVPLVSQVHKTSLILIFKLVFLSLFVGSKLTNPVFINFADQTTEAL